MEEDISITSLSSYRSDHFNAEDYSYFRVVLRFDSTSPFGNNPGTSVTYEPVIDGNSMSLKEGGELKSDIPVIANREVTEKIRVFSPKGTVTVENKEEEDIGLQFIGIYGYRR